MRATPPIPNRIRQFRTSAYTNIYELCPRESRLYGTESLYGDWDAPVLLLAKDFAPRSLVDARIAGGDRRPFRHEPAMRTNIMLQRYVASLDCPLLYGSSLAGLLRNDGKIRGALPDRAAVMPFARDVLRFAMSQMPNLKTIACLGADAWSCATQALEIKGADWKEHRVQRRAHKADKIDLVALAHPSTFPGGRTTVEGDWQAMSQRLAA